MRRPWLRSSALAYVALIGDLDGRMPARGTYILASLESLSGEPLALGGTDPFDGRVVVVCGQIAGDRLRADLLAEESKPQGIQDAISIPRGHTVQTLSLIHIFRAAIL